MGDEMTNNMDSPTGNNDQTENQEMSDTHDQPANNGDGGDHQLGAGGDAFSDGAKGNEERKVFVGGISYDTTNEDLVAYFGQFGEVSQAQVKYDQATGRSRGFAFVEFATIDACREVLKMKDREVKGKKVEVKPAKSRENKKVFVGGLPSDFSEEELRTHFETFGKVEDVEWPWDRTRNVRRNFAFVVFEDESGADAAAEQAKQRFGDRLCDVKKAVPQPKRFAQGIGGRGGTVGRGGGAGGYGGGYGGRGGGRGGAQGGWGNAAGNYYGGTGAGGGWGDWYGSGGGYGGYGYGSGYGGYGGGYYDDYTSNSGYDWSGWNQYAGAQTGTGGSSYDSYGQQAQSGNTGAAAGRGGRYQPY